MRRRDFIKGIVGAAIAWPIVARAQQRDAQRRIGVLMGFVEHDREGDADIAALLDGLGALNWKEGSSLRIDWRWGGQRPDPDGSLRGGTRRAFPRFAIGR